MVRAADEFRPSDLRLWGIAAATAGVLALLGAMVPVFVPARTLAGLHASRESRSATDLLALRAQLADLAEQQAKLRATSADLAVRIELAEQTVGAMASDPVSRPVATPAPVDVNPTETAPPPLVSSAATPSLTLRAGAQPGQRSDLAVTAPADAAAWPVPTGLAPKDAPKEAPKPGSDEQADTRPVASVAMSTPAPSPSAAAVARPVASALPVASAASSAQSPPISRSTPVAVAASAAPDGGSSAPALAKPATIRSVPGAEAAPAPIVAAGAEPAPRVLAAAAIAGPTETVAAKPAPPTPAKAEAVPSAVAPVVPMPASAEPLSAKSPRHVATGNVRAVGVAIGQPVTPADAMRTWQGLASKIGIMLVGMSPLLADDPAGSAGKVLVAGPVVSIGAATTLCARIDHEGINCMPMPYVGSDLSAANP